MDPFEPHFFGSSDRRLFGVYHLPRGRARAHGVLLCPPGPREYMRCHMAFRRIAVTLARLGFPVLRFDYYGTGDSGGDAREGNLSEWKLNIVAAADDLRECSGARKISAVGFRLGAALAASAPLDLVNLLLWEPVVSGTIYLDELRELHQRQFARLLFPPPMPAPGSGGDLLGLPLSPQAERELQALDLRQTPPAHAQHIAFVAAEARQEYTDLQSRLPHAGSGGPSFEFCRVPTIEQPDYQEMILISRQLLDTVTTVLTRRLD